MPGKSGTGPESIARRRRMAEALKMREESYSYREIAERLDVSISTAHDDVKTALAEITKEPAEGVRKMLLGRYDRLLRILEPMAEEGDLKAIDRVVKINQQIARLNALEQLAVLQVQGEGRELSAVDAFHAEMLGGKATDDEGDEGESDGEVDQ